MPELPLSSLLSRRLGTDPQQATPDAMPQVDVNYYGPNEDELSPLSPNPICQSRLYTTHSVPAEQECRQARLRNSIDSTSLSRTYSHRAARADGEIHVTFSTLPFSPRTRSRRSIGSPCLHRSSVASSFYPVGSVMIQLEDGSQFEVKADDFYERQEEEDLVADDKSTTGSRCKSSVIKLASFEQPAMRTFHLAWMTLAIAFLAAFASASLKPIIRDNLDLTLADLNHADVASVVGMVVARLLVMSCLDSLGPRIGTASVLLLVAPAIFCTSLVVRSSGFVAIRLLSGCAAAMFAISTFWAGSMFTANCVGLASAYVNGWGSAGSGIGILIMPALYKGISDRTSAFIAWRWAMFVPGGLCLIGGIAVLLLGQDTPSGSLKSIERVGSMSKQPVSPMTLVKVGLRNYRSWVLAVLYALTGGTELALSNVLTSYLFDQFQVPIETAGGLSALLGLINIISCPLGGLASDTAAEWFGVRGRIWTYFITQGLAGVFLLIMGRSGDDLGVTLAMMILASFFMHMGSGACFALVHFVSFRGRAVVSGLVASGAGVGGVALQSIFYGELFQETSDGILWNGVAMLASSFLLLVMWWPCWGSMLTQPRKGCTEMEYFVKEFTIEEIEERRHMAARRFAQETALQEQKKKVADQRGKENAQRIELELE